ncbi:MAG: polyprenyl synthetase family protein, partial [Deltaproteobacteria bacterium]|nr:polyprenyl synthetase family protein [Deltaproteobacteria bacterium]
LSRLKGGRGNDITEGKITLIVLRTLKKARASYKRRLVEILRAHTTERLRIEEAINIINRYDGISFSLRTARSTLDNSLRMLERKFKKREIKRFSDFADFCLNRDI